VSRGRPWIFLFSLVTALVEMTRPDGLLLTGVWLAIAVLQFAVSFASPLALGQRRSSGLAGDLLAAAPILLAPAHVVWRRLTYGEWLPNTYYAKHVAAWPESGLRYAASFVLEYGVWVWLLLLLALVVSSLLRVRSRTRDFRSGHLIDLLSQGHVAFLCIAGVVAHALYYTLLVGGDHFEYRVYSHLIPLLFVSTPWIASRIDASPRFVIAALTIFVLASWPIPWTHWLHTKDLRSREETFRLFAPVSPHLPVVLAPISRPWDALQQWLIERSVCRRHQEHKIFYQFQKAKLPTRAAGSEISWSQRVVYGGTTVGVLGWVLPEVAIIDQWGLNDRVVARSPIKQRPHRMMAHDRWPPPGYLECFRPNLVLTYGKKIILEEREPPLDDEQIRECEARDWNAGRPRGEPSRE
jgi:arabinofuranosyltransferase